MKLHSRSLNLRDRKRFLWESKKSIAAAVHHVRCSVDSIHMDIYFASDEYIARFERYATEFLNQYEEFLNARFK